MEPFQDPKELDNYKRKLGCKNAYCNISAKIWVFWDDDWRGEVLSDSIQQISLKLSKNNVEMICTAVYARCDALERLELWEELEALSVNINIPWTVGGDFNVIMNKEEKLGGLDFTQFEALDFSQCINNCALTEIKYEGSLFTWWNGRIERDSIFKRLDRVFGNQEFSNMFPTSEVHHLVRQGSDHAPLHVICNLEEEVTSRPFKFLNFWTRHPQFQQIVEENWRIDFVGCPFIEFQAKLKKVKGALAKWSNATFGNIFQKVTTFEDEVKVKEIQLEINATEENRADLKRAEANLKKILYLEEEFWKQKAGMRWFQDGDKNTRFFHNYVKGRRKKLHLAEIQMEQGDVVNSSDGIGAEAVSYFERQFKEGGTSEDESLLRLIPKLITPSQNEEMGKMPTKEEVKMVVFALNGDSTSGPDDFTFYFSYEFGVITKKGEDCKLHRP
ncbi:hypothetical protein KY290_032960 [Solanum tuberosum]|uniref:Uncharacterized protein n=1 Tax=Solanum tuberosum TaxID=4113 RepID=A0ABQ7UDN7_SOLTU|nr:hypothetical protein KY290_032960 [Solanum tuberosum]